MKCPNCKLENPPTALRCDCGYDFPSATAATADRWRRMMSENNFEERLLKRLTWAILAIVLLAGVILFEGERLAKGIQVNATISRSAFAIP